VTQTVEGQRVHTPGGSVRRAYGISGLSLRRER